MAFFLKHVSLTCEAPGTMIGNGPGIVFLIARVLHGRVLGIVPFQLCKKSRREEHKQHACHPDLDRVLCVLITSRIEPFIAIRWSHVQ